MIDAGLAGSGTRWAVALIVFASLASDVVLPLPSSVVSAGAVAVMGPLLGGVVIWAGMTLGHMIGYWIGVRFGARAVDRFAGPQGAAQLGRLGAGLSMTTMVILTRAVPVLSETVAIVAGASGMAFARFAIATMAANAGVALVYAGLATIAGGSAPFLLVFAASILVPLIGYIAMRAATGTAD